MKVVQKLWIDLHILQHQFNRKPTNINNTKPYFKYCFNKPMKKIVLATIVLTLVTLLSCKQNTNNQDIQKEPVTADSKGITFNSSNKKLNVAFAWAKAKALSFAHDGDDPVGLWYEAALPNREAFCMRDVSHQAIGAELLGLSKHNFNIFLKFGQNISTEMDYCSYWEINRHNLPAPVDYENDKDFWYNLPANFDVIYNAYRLYKWTGNKAYIEDPALQNFYSLSMDEYVDHWDLGFQEVQNRTRDLHVAKDSSRFGNKRGIPTYNEGGRSETTLGIDMTASLIAAYKAAAEMSKLRGDLSYFKLYMDKAQKEQKFLDDFWWDAEQDSYRSILYENGEFDYFMVGKDQAFLHYLLYFDVLSEAEKVKGVVDAYTNDYDKLIVELKSYLPIIFYENGQTAIANQMVIDLCSIENKRRDYPENSFTIIEHVTRGLMGVNVDAASNTFATLSRVENQEDWVEMKQIPLLSNTISVIHKGIAESKASNLSGATVQWSAQFLGNYEFLIVNGNKTKTQQIKTNEGLISFCVVPLKENDSVVVSTKI